MKKIFILIFSFFYFNAFSQSPEKFTYQSIVKNSSGYLIKSKDLGLRISILKNSNEGISVYSETHTTKTNINGLLTLNIGEGSSSDDFSAINWSSAEYFLKVEVDPMGGSNYLIETTSQLLSVPYALYAASSKQELVLKGQDCLKLNENDLTIEKIDLKEDVKEFNKGLDTLLGEHGINLSGGQKQRMSILRALVKPRELLIMDDYVSAVDHKTESKVINALFSHVNNQTLLLISHRISALTPCDEIIIMENGEIVDQGTHEELYKRNKEYKDTYDHQILEMKLEDLND